MNMADSEHNQEEVTQPDSGLPSDHNYARIDSIQTNNQPRDAQQQEDQYEDMNPPNDQNPINDQKTKANFKCFTCVGVITTLLLAIIAISFCLALGGWIAYRELIDESLQSQPAASLQQEDLKVIRELASLKNELNLTTIKDVIEELMRQKLTTVDELRQNEIRDEIESNQNADESGDGSSFSDLEVTNCTCGRNFEQIVVNFEEHITNLLTLVNESKVSFQNQLNRQSQNASDIHQQLYTELHNIQEQITETERYLEQRINTTRIEVEDRLDRHDHQLNGFNESLAQIVEDFRDELNETEAQLNQSVDRTLHDLSILRTKLNATREEIVSNVTESMDELKELLLNELTLARNDTNTLRNEFISEITSLNSALENLTEVVHEHHQNLSTDAEIRSNDHASDLQIVNTTLYTNFVNLRTSLNEYHMQSMENITFLANQTSANSSMLQGDLKQLNFTLLQVEDESYQNHTTLKTVIEANNASIAQSLQNVGTRIDNLDHTTMTLKQNVEAIKTRTGNLEHDQGHITSDLNALDAKVTFLHTSTAVSIIHGNKLLLIVTITVATVVSFTLL